MDPGMEDRENSGGELPQLRHVMNRLMADDMDVRPITQDVGGQQHALDKDFPREHLGPKQPLYDPYKDTFRGKSFGKDHEESSGRARFRARPLLESSPHRRLNSINMEGRQPQQSLFPREHLGPKQPLYDPYKDTFRGKSFGKDHEESSGRARFRARPLLESSPHRRLNSVNMEGRQPQQSLAQDKFIQHAYGSLNEKATVNLERDRRTSPGGSPPTDDCAVAEPELLLQPETRAISHDQLVIEVKGIYAGLVMVEAKCIDIDEKQTAAAQEKDLSKKIQLKNDQWQSLIALHKQLLHEHHDFFLASQHPAASPALSRLAAKYSMPARMWRHGIHAFLEVLRHRLPDSLEPMLAFIYIAYSMMALLYETVPTFEDTWIECLGDLGRYRMAIEDDEPRDRETWANVTRFWYNKAADKSPTVGRLYHHLAILARPYSLEQLSLYIRVLTCVTPFESARGSVLTLFRAVLSARHTTGPQPSSLESAFIKANTDTQDESSTEHQLSNTFADLLRSALDQISYWKMRIISFGKAPGSFRRPPVGAAYKIRSSVALTLSIFTLFIVPTTARTIPRNASNEGSIGSFNAALIPLAYWPYLAFVIITLLVAQYLAHTKDPIFVWGCMMSVWAFGWWTIRADPSTTLPISVV